MAPNLLPVLKILAVLFFNFTVEKKVSGRRWKVCIFIFELLNKEHVYWTLLSYQTCWLFQFVRTPFLLLATVLKYTEFHRTTGQISTCIITICFKMCQNEQKRDKKPKNLFRIEPVF